MIDETGHVAVANTATSVRQGATGHNVRYVLGASMLGVVIAFAAVAIFLGGKLPL